MFHHREKVLKKDSEEPSEIELTLAKEVFDLEQDCPQKLKHAYASLFILSATELNYVGSDKKEKQIILVNIPFKSLVFYKKICKDLVAKFEEKMGIPVAVVARRTIISKRAPINSKEPRPRTRTLTHVHEAILEDITFPTRIVGKRIRFSLSGKKTFKVLLDPLDKEAVKNKLEGWAHVYERLTNKHAQFDFGPQTFEVKPKKKNKKQYHQQQMQQQ